MAIQEQKLIFFSYSDKVHVNFPYTDEALNLTSRANKDPRNVNNHGRKILDLCLGTGVCIVNGRAGQDSQVGEFTCLYGENPSTIDYMLSDPELFTVFNDFYVDCRDESHHLPLCLSLHLGDSIEKEITQNSHVDYLPRFIWKQLETSK